MADSPPLAQLYDKLRWKFIVRKLLSCCSTIEWFPTSNIPLYCFSSGKYTRVCYGQIAVRCSVSWPPNSSDAVLHRKGTQVFFLEWGVGIKNLSICTQLRNSDKPSGNDTPLFSYSYKLKANEIKLYTMTLNKISGMENVISRSPFFLFCLLTSQRFPKGKGAMLCISLAS